MSKWADFLITGVRYDEKHNFIILVELREDKNDTVGIPQNFSREYIIDKIKKNITFITAIKKNENEKTFWSKGANVSIISIDNVEYIRTDKNKTKSDNLESLPEI